MLDAVALVSMVTEGTAALMASMHACALPPRST
jgi:hypothetical protein